MRSLLIVFALAAALVVVREAARLAANLAHVAGGAPGSTLHASDFAGATRDLDLFEGRLSAQLVEGALQLGVREAGELVYAATGPQFGDFDLQVEARPLAGPLDNAYGVLFRLREPRPAPLLQIPGIAGRGGISYTLFLVSSDGYYQVRRAREGEQRIVSAWAASPLIAQGLEVSNRLRVIAEGDRLRFQINGEAVALCVPDEAEAQSTWSNGVCVGGEMRLSTRDEAPAPGRIALVAQALRQGGVMVAFDNLLVRAPAGRGASA